MILIFATLFPLWHCSRSHQILLAALAASHSFDELRDRSAWLYAKAYEIAFRDNCFVLA
jgi:hypothetical protein